MGVDLVSNLTRFQAYLLDHAVRFTVKGEIFKTTERILQDLIPTPGVVERSEILHFMDGFSQGAVVDSTGERTIAITAAGREWEPMDLDAKLASLLEFVVEERHWAASRTADAHASALPAPRAARGAGSGTT